MKLSHICRIFVAAFALLLCVPVHADLTTTFKMTMDLSKMTIGGKPISPEQLESIKKSPMFGGDLEMTTYQSSHKVKVITPVSIAIVDLDTKTSTMLLPQMKKYMTIPVSASMLQMANSTEANVVDMNTTKTFLGYQTHLFKLYFKNAMMTMSGYAWICKDLPSPPSMGSSGNPMLDIIKAKMQGAPLKMSGDISMPSSFGQMSYTYEVTAISTDPIPDSTFAIPDGYTQMQMPTSPAAPH